MATVESKPAAASTNGAPGIPVENPATGEVITTVPAMSAEEVKALAARGRKAQPEWAAMGFDGRAKVLRRAQKWVTDNAERIIDVIVSETGKTYEDAQLAEISYAANAFGFWAKMAPEFLADERVKSSNLLVKGSKLIVRYRPLGVVGVIGPWNYPLTNSFGDCIPALGAGNGAVFYGMQNAGQTCISVERVYVEEGVYDEFVAKVADKVGRLRLGQPAGPGSVEVGAITIAQQVETIDDHVKDAVAKGAK